MRYTFRMRRGESLDFLTLVVRAALAALASPFALALATLLVTVSFARAVPPPSSAPEAARELDGPLDAPAGELDERRTSGRRSSSPSSFEKESTTAPSALPPYSARNERQPAFLYRYLSSISPRVGVGWDAKEQANKQALLYLVGVHFEFTGSDDAAYEAGADAQSNGRGAVAFSRLFRFGRGRARPYAKAGGGIELDPTDRLAGLLKHENFQLRGSGGIEMTLHRQLSLRLELEAAASIRTQRAALLVGYAYAW